jgi:protein SCO1/2
MGFRGGKWVIGAALLALASPLLPAQTNRQLQYELRGVEVTERIGEKIPLDLEFVDNEGRNVTLAQYFKPGRPVLITLNYARCPRLCSLQLDELAKSFQPMEWVPGNEFVALTVSIDPEETFERAKTAKNRYLGAVGKAEADKGWHFLVWPDESHVRALAESLGYSYRFDPDTGEYRHKAAAFVVTGEGVISHYLRNLNYDARDVQARLAESAEGKLGQISEDETGFGLNCFTFEYTDNMSRSFWYMRIGGIGIVIFVVSFVGYWWVYEFRKSRQLKMKAEAT